MWQAPTSNVHTTVICWGHSAHRRWKGEKKEIFLEMTHKDCKSCKTDQKEGTCRELTMTSLYAESAWSVAFMELNYGIELQSCCGFVMVVEHSAPYYKRWRKACCFIIIFTYNVYNTSQSTPEQKYWMITDHSLCTF